MNDTERFQVKQTLDIIEDKLITESNSCEFEYYKKLKEELLEKLKE